jgi:glycosyltransferase involved in cell wall biosynthesis
LTGRVVALTPTPLSSGYRARLEELLGTAPLYLTLADLRRRPVSEVLPRLWSLGGCVCVLPIESATTEAVLPILESVALAARPSRIEVVGPDLSRRVVPRRHAVPALASLVRASAEGVAAVRSARRELEQLAAEPRIEPSLAPSRSRLLYLNGNLWLGLKAGGSVGHVAGVVNGLAAAAYDVDLATLVEPIGIAPGVTVHELEPPTPFGLPFEGTYYRANQTVTHQALELARRAPPALVYQRMSIASYSGVLISRARRIPLVLEYNGSEVWVASNWGAGLRYEREARLAEEVSLRHAHLVVTVSEALRNDLLAQRVDSGRIVMHPNGVDPDVFSPELDGAAVRERLGIPPGATVVGFIGTFGQWHGAEVLARSIGLLRDDDVVFLLVGDGLRLPAVRETVEALGASDRVRFTGLVPQLEAPEYLAASDVLVSPHIANADGTAFFGSPTKLFEYMASGKAIVASRLDQIADVLTPSLDAAALPEELPAPGEPALAILAAPGDDAELAVALRFAIGRPEWRKVLGSNARNEALTHYTWSHHVAAILAALEP